MANNIKIKGGDKDWSDSLMLAGDKTVTVGAIDSQGKGIRWTGRNEGKVGTVTVKNGTSTYNIDVYRSAASKFISSSSESVSTSKTESFENTGNTYTMTLYANVSNLTIARGTEKAYNSEGTEVDAHTWRVDNSAHKNYNYGDNGAYNTGLSFVKHTYQAGTQGANTADIKVGANKYYNNGAAIAEGTREQYEFSFMVVVPQNNEPETLYRKINVTTTDSATALCEISVVQAGNSITFEVSGYETTADGQKKITLDASAGASVTLTVTSNSSWQADVTDTAN